MTYNPFFDYQKERNSMRSGARHRKCGSRTKYVSLPSDHLTAAEIKKRSGEVSTYDMGVPMAWKTYKKMPDDLKRQYMNGLIDRYHPSGNQLAAMMGCTNVTIGVEIKRLGLKHKMPAQGQHVNQTAEEFAAWHVWTDGEAAAATVVSAPEEPEPEETPIAEPEQSGPKEAQESTMRLRMWDAEVCGEFNPGEFVGFLGAVLRSGDRVRIRIHVEPLTEVSE